jgi:hypothetical protein
MAERAGGIVLGKAASVGLLTSAEPGRISEKCSDVLHCKVGVSQ